MPARLALPEFMALNASYSIGRIESFWIVMGDAVESSNLQSVQSICSYSLVSQQKHCLTLKCKYSRKHWNINPIINWKKIVFSLTLPVFFYPMAL